MRKKSNYLSKFVLSGTVHPMLTVTHTSYSCHEVLGKKSTDSSPSHSQVSRNSSRKSNNSLLVNNGKLEGIRSELYVKENLIKAFNCCRSETYRTKS